MILYLPYIFLLAVETLAIAVRENSNINGITIEGEETKILQYAIRTRILKECGQIRRYHVQDTWRVHRVSGTVFSPSRTFSESWKIRYPDTSLKCGVSRSVYFLIFLDLFRIMAYHIPGTLDQIEQLLLGLQERFFLHSKKFDTKHVPQVSFSELHGT